jgi:tRNA A37 threonylcarbamoyladenosine modification protein TsaB
VKTLVIENSSSEGTLLAAADDQIILHRTFSGAGALAASLEFALKELGTIGEIIVGIGPGSYTGLRVAIASAIGLGLAQGSRLYGVPSVLGYPGLNYSVVGDARRGTFFYVSVQNGQMTRLPYLVPAGEIGALVKSSAGEPIYSVSPVAGLDEIVVAAPEARFLTNRRESFTELAEPLYLKEPHITTIDKGTEERKGC